MRSPPEDRSDENESNRFIYIGQAHKLSYIPPDSPRFKIQKQWIRGLIKEELEDFRWFVDTIWAKRTSSLAQPALPNNNQFRLRRTRLLGRLSTVEPVHHPNPENVDVSTFG